MALLPEFRNVLQSSALLRSAQEKSPAELACRQATVRDALFGAKFRSAQAVMVGVTDAEARIRLTANVARAIYEGESTELSLLRGASTFSPALRKIEAQLEKLRYEMQDERIKALFAQGKARRDLDAEQARRILWMFTSRDVYRLLVDEAGWSPEAYQNWLTHTLADALVEWQADRRTVRKATKSARGVWSRT